MKSCSLNGKRTRGKLTQAEIVALYKTKSTTEIAKLDGTTKCTVLRQLRKAGATMKASGRPRVSAHDFSYFAKALNLGIGSLRLMRLLVIRKLGGSCTCCGISDLRVLDLNHKDASMAYNNSTGEKYRQYKQVLLGEQLDFLEVRCSNCNRVHEYERGFYPPIPAEIFEINV